MMKLSAFAFLLALTAFASTARAETPATSAQAALFDRCVDATKRFNLAPKGQLDVALLELAMDGADKGSEQCAGLAQRMLLAHRTRLDKINASDRARVEVVYARAFATFGTPELRIASEGITAYAAK